MIVPPPVAPLALRVAPVSVILLPPTAMLPPLPVDDDTSSVPETCVLPAASPSTSALPSIRAEPGSRLSGIRTVSRTAPITATGRIWTRVPGLMPLDLTPTPGSAAWKNPSPERSSVATSPELSATLPSGTVIVPVLATLPPSSAANPPLPMLIAPAFDTSLA